MSPSLEGAALVVHLYIAANGADQQADRDYLIEVWRRLQDQRDLTMPLAGLPVTAPSLDPTGALAGLRHPASAVPHVEEALLRREHDAYCLSLYREPAGATWATLQAEWESVLSGLTPPSGFLGSAMVFLAHLPRSGPLARLRHRGRPDPASLTSAVRNRMPPLPAPADGETPVTTWQAGVTASAGFAVWEASESSDERSVRRFVVVAPHDADERLSGWTWVVGPDLRLPPLARYLLHAAKVRSQLRLWKVEGPTLRANRIAADLTVDALLTRLTSLSERSSPARLLDTAKQVTALQAGEPGLVRTHTALLEMHRTVDIATANLTALSHPDTNGLFADDRALGAWFAQQLDDDAVYLGAARDRAAHVATLADQMLQRRAQEERERFNLALTGAIGAVLMVLAASQSFQYRPPLPYLVQPAVIALLGAVALLSTLLMLWIIARSRWWSRALLWVGWGLVGATAGWTLASATLTESATATTTRWWSLAGFAIAGGLAATWSAAAAARSRREPP